MFGDIIAYKEKSAQNKRGFLLYSPFKGTHFFRIYEDENFTDYDIFAEEIEIQILGDWISLYTSDENNKVDFSTRVLGKE